MTRNDLAPVLAGLIIGQAIVDLTLSRMTVSGWLSLIGASVYFGWLLLDAYRLNRCTRLTGKSER